MKLFISITFIFVFSLAAFGASNKSTECTYSFSPAQQNSVPIEGGNYTVSVITQAGCAWSAVSNSEWITITNAGAGSGNGSVSYSVAAGDGHQRLGRIAIAGLTFFVVQTGVPCTYTFNPTPNPIPASGGAVSYNVTKSHPDCYLEERNSGTTFVNREVAEANFGAARSVLLRFAISPILGGSSGSNATSGGFVQVSVSQAAACNFSLNSTSQNFSASGGTGVFQLTSTIPINQCQPAHIFPQFAIAKTNASWITFNNAPDKIFDGVNYTVAPNPDFSPRTGTITVETFAYDHPIIFTLTITQPARACGYNLSQTSSLLIPAAGGGGTFNVETQSACSYTATTTDAWITIDANASGTGNGTISYTVAANTGAGRTGTITVGGQTFTVNQAAVKSRKRVRFI